MAREHTVEYRPPRIFMGLATRRVYTRTNASLIFRYRCDERPPTPGLDDEGRTRFRGHETTTALDTRWIRGHGNHGRSYLLLEPRSLLPQHLFSFQSATSDPGRAERICFSPRDPPTGRTMG